jgi:hypothetical protein
MKLKSILIAGMLAAACASASANDYTAPTLAMTGGPVDFSTSIGAAHTAGAFTDTYTFTYSGNPGMGSGWFTNLATSGGEIDFGTATLNGTNITPLNFGPLSTAAFFNIPVSGLVTLVITGTEVGATASYGGVLNVTAPVPEPEAYGMLLGGLALLGVVARRRKS